MTVVVVVVDVVVVVVVDVVVDGFGVVCVKAAYGSGVPCAAAEKGA